MSYQPKTWENKPSTASPINATNLNHMEGGIKTNDDNITDAQNAILTLQGEMLQAQGDISALETLVDSILPVDTESGNPAVITDAFGGACKSLKLTLEPIQSGSGTPSPQNVRPISGLSELSVVRIGKNILNSADIVKGYYDYVTMLIESAGSEVYRGVKLYVAPGTYTISFSKSASVVRLIADGVINYNPATNVKTYTFTVTATGYIAISWRDPNSANWDDTAQVQLEIGSTATTYEPYTGESITRTYGTTIYGGSDDVTGDGVISDTDLIDLGSLTWTYNAQQFQFYSNVLNGALDGSDLVCSCYELDSSNYFTNPNPHSRGIISGRIYIVDTNYTDPNALKIALNGMMHSYKLATPSSIPLTLQNITLLHGDNVLTTDADSIEASYSADIALYIAKKIAEGSNNNRSVDNSSLTKGGSGDEEVKEEVKEEEKEEEIEIKEEEPLTKEVR